MAKKILIVDDANFMRMIVKNTLIPHGFEIVGEAANGDEAVTKYEELKPDLVTMDITMKEKDGLRGGPGDPRQGTRTRGSSWSPPWGRRRC